MLTMVLDLTMHFITYSSYYIFLQLGGHVHNNKKWLAWSIVLIKTQMTKDLRNNLILPKHFFSSDLHCVTPCGMAYTKQNVLCFCRNILILLVWYEEKAINKFLFWKWLAFGCSLMFLLFIKLSLDKI